MNSIHLMSNRLGVKIGSRLEIASPFSNKREFRLNFKTYSFNLDNLSKSYSFIANSQGAIQFEFLEELNSFYASSDYWFIHNGAIVKQSVLFQNSVIEFWGHKFSFKSIQESIESESDEIFSFSQKENIFIVGETGTGKTELAKRIHQQVASHEKFIHLNLSAIPIGLIESTLFGHKKGAFTGAFQDEPGAIEKAGTGFLYLDELDSVSKEIQVKLLLCIEGQCYYRLGEFVERKARCHFIFSSSSTPGVLLENDIWRKDFYYRIMSCHFIELKPLRENKVGIKKILDDFSLKNNVFIEQSLEKFYMSRSWHGNYRELISHLQRKLRTDGKGVWKYSDCDVEFQTQEVNEKDALAPTLEQVKIEYIRKLLFKHNGNVSKVSQILKVSQQTIRRIIRSHDYKVA
ncbi:MAG: hypothetical protein Fur0010_15670 [Bdellovibrio sp.]